MKKTNSKYEATSASLPKIEKSNEGKLRGGFVSLSNRVGTPANLNCPSGESSCSITNKQCAYIHNINCPGEITASCIGYSDKGTNLNCGAHAKKCAGTLPPDTTEPTSTSSNIGEISESLLF